MERDVDLAYTDYVVTELKVTETCAIRDAFIAGAKWADEHPEDEWRDATIQPKANVEVLADVAFDTGYGIAHDYCIAHFINGQWYTREKQPIRVAHWQPLPGLPKDDE